MKASELVKHLLDNVSQYGDREVLMVDRFLVRTVKEIEVHPEAPGDWSVYTIAMDAPTVRENKHLKPKGFILL